MKKFIAIEGIDGSGKDYQVMRLAEFIKENNKYANVCITREPTDISTQGKIICGKLESEVYIPKGAEAVHMIELFTLDRKEHCGKLITPFLPYADVISSRYDLSTYAYQISQFPPDQFNSYFNYIYDKHGYDENQTIVPDVTFLLDVDVDIALARIAQRDGSRKELFEKREFLLLVRDNFLRVAKELEEKDNRKIIVIDASLSKEEVTNLIINHLK